MRDILYIGCRHDSMLDWWEDIRREKLEATATILEIWSYNVEIWQSKLPEGCDIVLGDVRDVGAIFGPCFFREILWRNGPEHVAEEEIPQTIRQLKIIVTEKIVLEYPAEEYQQGIAFGNPYEQHLWYPVPEFFEEMGFETELFGLDNSQVRSTWRRNAFADFIA